MACSVQKRFAALLRGRRTVRPDVIHYQLFELS